MHAAVDYLRSRADVDPDRIGGIGLSVGGEMMIGAAAESDGLAAIVSEGRGFVPYARPSPWKGRRRRSGSGACSCTRW